MRTSGAFIILCMPALAYGTTIISLTNDGQSSIVATHSTNSLALDVTLTLDASAAHTFAFGGALTCSSHAASLLIADRTAYPSMAQWDAWDTLGDPPVIGSNLTQRRNIGYMEMAGNYQVLLNPGTTLVENITVTGLAGLPDGDYTFTIIDPVNADPVLDRGWWSNTGEPIPFDVVGSFTLHLLPDPATILLLLVGGLGSLPRRR
jgi:hypothetical protein